MWLAHSAGRSGVAGMIVPAPHYFPSQSWASILPHSSLERKKFVSPLDGEKVTELVFSPVSKQHYFISLNTLKVICGTSPGLNIFFTCSCCGSSTFYLYIDDVFAELKNVRKQSQMRDNLSEVYHGFFKLWTSAGHRVLVCSFFSVFFSISLPG